MNLIELDLTDGSKVNLNPIQIVNVISRNGQGEITTNPLGTTLLYHITNDPLIVVADLGTLGVPLIELTLVNNNKIWINAVLITAIINGSRVQICTTANNYENRFFVVQKIAAIISAYTGFGLALAQGLTYKGNALAFSAIQSAGFQATSATTTQIFTSSNAQNDAFQVDQDYATVQSIFSAL
jgi:hypothetical protein